jgi:hypothetical protein
MAISRERKGRGKGSRGEERGARLRGYRRGTMLGS